MQDIENDMDDLFRRAGENYPLRKSKGDWENLLKKMPLPVEQELTLEKQTKNDYKKILIIFLLAVILILSGLLIFKLNPKLNPSGNLAATKELQKSVQNKVSQNDKPVTTKSVSKVIIAGNRSSQLNTGKKEKVQQKVSLPANQEVNNLSIHPGHETVNENNIGSSNSFILAQTDFDDPETNFPLINNEIEKQKSVQIESSAISSLEKKKLMIKARPLKENGFYLGINAGPDFSKVKSGNFTSPGFNAGIILGYQINKKFFAETGLSIDSKYYSSDGHLFKEEGASMPDGMVVMDLRGYSRIIEIPVKIGYNIYKKNKESVFISTGASAYIMTMEKNNYDVMMNGNPGKMVGLYQKNNVKMPAAFNLSLGWEHQLRPLVKLRIEPYLKLPLQGIGVGKLPVTSTGIQVGIYRMIK